MQRHGRKSGTYIFRDGGAKGQSWEQATDPIRNGYAGGASRAPLSPVQFYSSNTIVNDETKSRLI